MSSNNIDYKVKAELLRLIKQGSRISGLTIEHYSPGDTYNNYALFNKDLKNFQLSAENLLINRFGTESLYYKYFMKASNFTKLDNITDTYHNKQYMIHSQIGILESILNALENGLTDDLFYERELVVFSDMLKQAYTFLDIHLKYAAAVYGRIVLETAVREYTKVKLPDSDYSLKFDQLIINLKKSGIILQPFENSLRANYGIGTAAAHNDKFEKYSENEIKEYLNFIRDRVLTLK
ncbi:hypothetical protein FXW07_17795 [Methanosarcina sp. DH1]|uniref:hypothetical protein n=1 Tax=Methanosarcina sp. DH1 TaxID=2605695 RepID=UPI001E321D77|nr:hypothetical protein [Methanosarcina sp. DH1]MCC4768400.1 hypothetical protein [Methanosarcina sp. DH1]